MKKLHASKSLLSLLFSTLLSTQVFAAPVKTPVKFNAVVSWGNKAEFLTNLEIKPSASPEDLKNLIHAKNKQWKLKQQRLFILDESDKDNPKFHLMDKPTLSDSGFKNDAFIVIGQDKGSQLFLKGGILLLGTFIGAATAYGISLLQGGEQPKETKHPQDVTRKKHRS